MASPLVAWQPDKTTGLAPSTNQQPRKEKHQQRLEELCAATIRALTGNSRLRYRGHRLEQIGDCRSARPISIPTSAKMTLTRFAALPTAWRSD